MSFHTMTAAKAFALQLSFLMLAAPAAAQLSDPNATSFVDPSSGAGPFADASWIRGDTDTYFAAWENFRSRTGANQPAAPAQGFLGQTSTPAPILPTDESAEITYLADSGGGIITGTENLYTGTTSGEFEVALTQVGPGEGFDTRLVLQTATIGSALLDEATQGVADIFRLEYENAAEETITVLPEFGELLSTGPSGSTFGGVNQQWAVGWDLEGVSPEDFRILFTTGTNVSLTTVVLDALVTPGVLEVPGDYTGDGEVTIADYDAWVAAAGTTVAAPGEGADGNGDGVVNTADYAVWRDAFVAAPATPAAIAIPEPGGAYTLALLVTVGFCFGSHTLTQSRRSR